VLITQYRKVMIDTIVLLLIWLLSIFFYEFLFLFVSIYDQGILMGMLQVRDLSLFSLKIKISD